MLVCAFRDSIPGMKIFVFEFITGGGLAGVSLPPGLAHEGDLMIHALIRDLIQAGYRDLVTLRDKRLPAIKLPVKSFPVSQSMSEDCQALMSSADATFLIAPETGGVLLQLTRQAGDSGCLLMGCDAHSVELAAGKRDCCEHLRCHGIAVPDSYSIDDMRIIPDRPLVLKPDDGVGGEACYLFDDRVSLRRWLDRQEDCRTWLIQPYIPGEAASLNLFCQNNGVLVLAVNRQQFEFREGKGVLSGVVVNEFAGRRDEFRGLARKITDAVPGLRGFVGVDLILTDAGPVVIEINPRLTTSYAGLHESLGYNPAELLFQSQESAIITERLFKTAVPVTLQLSVH